EVGAVLRELLDRVPAVAEDPLVAVDERDGGAGRRGVDETVVQRGVPGLSRQRGHVDARGTIGAAYDGEFCGTAAYLERGLVLRSRVAHGASSRILSGVSSARRAVTQRAVSSRTGIGMPG